MVMLLISVLFALSVEFLPCLEARKLTMAPSLRDSSLVQGDLSEGPALPSSPGNGHGEDHPDETLIAVHLAMTDRILQSVPSPGAGH